MFLIQIFVIMVQNTHILHHSKTYPSLTYHLMCFQAWSGKVDSFIRFLL